MAENTSWKAEIIAVGTELLMGEVINSNAAYLSQELAAIGIDVFYHTSVGDNPQRIKGLFQQAFRRSNLILVTGGLGPTDDDLTVSTLAELLDTPLAEDEGSVEKIKAFFITRDMPMSSTNLKQALRPVDGEPILNRMGTAPGLYWDITHKVGAEREVEGPCLLLAFPGVPREMKAMWTEEALPRILAQQPDKRILVTRFLKFTGIGESLLGEKLRDLMAQSSPTVSPYVGQAEVKIRIAAKAETREAAYQLITPTETEILSRVGQYCFGKDEETLEEVVANLLRAKKLQLAVAESCTGGLVSSRLTDISGSSDYTFLNMVTYSNAAKTSQLGVPEATLATHGAVSEAVAKAMAEGILEKSQADVGLSITGIAGPTGGTDAKPVGLVYIGLAQAGKETLAKKVLVNPRYDRKYIKYWFSQYALHYLRLWLLGLLDADKH